MPSQSLRTFDLEDRAIFMAEDFPVTLHDGITVDVQDDPDGYLSAGDSEDVEHIEYLFVNVEDPATGVSRGLGSVGIPDYYSGHHCRAELWDHVVSPTGYYRLLAEVRAARDTELREQAEWAARDVETRP